MERFATWLAVQWYGMRGDVVYSVRCWKEKHLGF